MRKNKMVNPGNIPASITGQSVQAVLMEFEVLPPEGASILDAPEAGILAPVLAGMNEAQNQAVTNLEKATVAFKSATTGLRDAIRAAVDVGVPASVIVGAVRFAAAREGIGRQTVSAALIACGIRQKPAKAPVPVVPAVVPAVVGSAPAGAAGPAVAASVPAPAGAVPPAGAAVNPMAGLPVPNQPTEADKAKAAAVPAATETGKAPVPATVPPAAMVPPASGSAPAVPSAPTVPADPAVMELKAYLAGKSLTGTQIGRAILACYGTSRAQSVLAEAVMALGKA